MDLMNALRKIGLTQQEAVIFTELCRHSELTGYEAAKISGISRSNAYGALSNLVDKGYAYVIEASSVKYTPVPKEELIMNARRDLEETMKVIDEELQYSKHTSEPYITIEGEKYVVDKLINIIHQAKLRLYLSLDEALMKRLEEPLREAIDRGLKVVVLSESDPGAMATTFYQLGKPTSLKVIADTKEVLAGTVEQGLYSKNSTFVHIIREAFVNEITIIENN